MRTASNNAVCTDRERCYDWMQVDIQLRGQAFMHTSVKFMDHVTIIQITDEIMTYSSI